MSLKTFGSRSFAALTFGALTLAGISAAAAGVVNYVIFARRMSRR